MATGGASVNSSPQPIPQPSHRGAPVPSQRAAISPPTKREVASWLKRWRKTGDKPDEKVETAPGIFGVPLADSIRYANVAISLTDELGESFIYGYVPIVVAKCGVFLKEKATEVEGIFRLSGSAKRIKDLQNLFNSPDRYGKGLDWTGYTVHDAANILRRYLNQLPEPIVPLDFYERFREPLRPHLARSTEGEGSFDLTMDQQSQVVSAYQKLITELPPLNRQLLLYILDLLAVFSSKSDLNLMPAANLAAIFQPGIISHPQHDMAPLEYRLSQDVLIFLIENQDHFLFGMSGTGIDEKTKQDVESGVPSVKSPKSAIGRSASNASAGADSLRKYSVRRNVSVGSRGSRERNSPGVSGPGTPTGLNQTAPASVGVARSNTVPSKRSPAVASGRFHRLHEASSPVTTPTIQDFTATDASAQSASARQNPSDNPPIQHTDQPLPSTAGPISVNTGTQPPGRGERKISGFLSKSPLFGPIDPQGKKLQKRRGIPGSTNESAQSSQTSLQGDTNLAFHTPLMTPDLTTAGKGDPIRTSPAVINTGATPVAEHPALSPNSAERPNHTPHLHPPRSPAGSLHSRSSVTDHSEFDTLDNPHDLNPRYASQQSTETEKKRHRWRFSSSAKKGDDSPLAPPPRIGENAGARGSNSSIGSAPGKLPRKSFTGESQATTATSGAEGSGIFPSGQPGMHGHTGQESSEALKDMSNNGEEKRGGLFGKWKAKRSEKKEERRERDAEKERAKSPPRSTDDGGKPRSSLSAFAHDHLGANPRKSFDRSRGGSSASDGVPPTLASTQQAGETMGLLETVKERPVTEAREKEMTGVHPSQPHSLQSPPPSGFPPPVNDTSTGQVGPAADTTTPQSTTAEGTEKS